MKYGNGDDPCGRLALHAFLLCFEHPVTHQRMEFESPIPQSFKMIFEQNKKKKQK
jgi:23S rRNA pseudouridine1911/1915/1917 synthase